MTYPRKLKTITFEVNGQPVTISDTPNNMAATEAYNEYLRGGFIKCRPKGVPEGADIVVNASLITKMMVTETTASMDKGDDDFCNVECDCGGGGGGKQATVTIRNSGACTMSVTFNDEEVTHGVLVGESMDFDRVTGDICSIQPQCDFGMSICESDDYNIQKDESISYEKHWYFTVTGSGTCETKPTK